MGQSMANGATAEDAAASSQPGSGATAATETSSEPAPDPVPQRRRNKARIKARILKKKAKKKAIAERVRPMVSLTAGATPASQDGKGTAMAGCLTDQELKKIERAGIPALDRQRQRHIDRCERCRRELARRYPVDTAPILDRVLAAIGK